MKTLIKAFLIFLLINLILFAACAFTVWDVNVSNWSIQTRGVVSVFGFVFGCIPSAIYYIENK